MEEGKERVCVTGGTGCIGSWIIKRLLEYGCSVNTTVGSHPEQKKDVSFLTNLPGASQRLQIPNVDLTEPESLKEATEGRTGVFHVAIPMDFEEIGSLGILKACLSSKTVKRVVYSSSASAVTHTEKEVEEESSGTDVDSLRTL